MHDVFKGHGIDDVYRQILYTLMNKPDYYVKPRDIETRELINTTIHLTAPRFRLLVSPERKFSRRYFAGELCFYLSGSRSLDFISYYASFWNKCSDDGKTVNSCYGYKLFKEHHHYSMGNAMVEDSTTQWQNAKHQLIKDPSTRKAVALVYKPHDAMYESKDTPCTIYLHFMIRKFRLDLHTYIRSNDIWLGVPYDVAFFAFIQEMMLAELHSADYDHLSDLILGDFFLHSGSLHIYENNYDKAQKVIGEPVYHKGKGFMWPVTMQTVSDIPKLLEYEQVLRREKSAKVVSGDNCILQIANMLKEEAPI